MTSSDVVQVEPKVAETYFAQGTIWVPPPGPDLDFLLGWARARILAVDDFGPAAAVGIVRRQRLAAAAVWHNQRGSNIELSFAADDPRWATRQTVAFVLGYPFWFLGVRRVTAICEQKNKRVRKLLEGVGFKREGTLTDLFPQDNGVIFAMTRRWWQKSPWNVAARGNTREGVMNGQRRA